MNQVQATVSNTKLLTFDKHAKHFAVAFSLKRTDGNPLTAEQIGTAEVMFDGDDKVHTAIQQPDKTGFLVMLPIAELKPSMSLNVRWFEGGKRQSSPVVVTAPVQQPPSSDEVAHAAAAGGLDGGTH